MNEWIIWTHCLIFSLNTPWGIHLQYAEGRCTWENCALQTVIPRELTCSNHNAENLKKNVVCRNNVYRKIELKWYKANSSMTIFEKIIPDNIHDTCLGESAQSWTLSYRTVHSSKTFFHRDSWFDIRPPLVSLFSRGGATTLSRSANPQYSQHVLLTPVHHTRL